MRLTTIVGARPQFIKAAAVSRVLRANGGVEELLVHTGQHYDENMSDVFFDELEIPQPDYHLGIGSGSHGTQTGRMLEAIERVLREERPDGVLVYGDTNSTLAGALAAAKLHVPVAHVEAGMRSFNRRMPEEINRVLTDHLSGLLFASTQTAVNNLRHEGIPAEAVHLVGDVMYDVALYYAHRAATQSRVLAALGLAARQYVLATIHRAENTDHAGRLAAIVGGLEQVAQEIPVVFPVHPRTRKVLEHQGRLPTGCPGLRLVAPVGYLDMVTLEKNAAVIATDSGGVQKEAYLYRVPCVTLRDETEWVELVEVGANRLCPPQAPAVVAEAIRAGVRDGFPAAAPRDLYGDGTAAARMADLLCAGWSQTASSAAQGQGYA